MSEEKTCKQCEHYQFYDGPERTAGREESVMFCPKLKEQMHGNGYSENVTRCAWGYFTPKKPEQAKTCKQCEHCGPTRNSEWPYSIYCAYHNGHYTLPLVFDCKNFTPKETEKTVERVCSTCGAEGSSIFKEPCYSCYQSIFNRARPNWRPKDTPKKSCRTCGFGIENNGTGKLCNQKCLGMFSEYSLWKPAELKVKINGKPACEYHGLEIEDNNLSDCQKTKESDPGIRSGDFIDGSKIKAETITEEQYKRFNHQQKTPN